MQAAASSIEKDFTLLVSNFREGNYLKLITIAEQNPDLLVSQIRQNPKALLIQNPEGNSFLHELTEQGHKELAIQLAKLNSYDIKIENGYIKFLYDSPGFLNYSDIKIAEKSIQNSAEIELEQRFSALTGKPIGEYKGEEEYAGREEKLINLLNELPSVPTQIKAQSPKLEIELDKIQQEFTTIFDESLGESDQLPEEQPLLDRKIDIEEDNQNNKKGKEPIQEIRRRKGPDEGKLIIVNQSLPVFQPKQNSLPKYAAYGGLIGAVLGAGGMLIGIGIGCAIASSLVFPPLGLALVVIGACAALGLAIGAIYSKKDVIANKLATVFHKGTADNKTFIMEPDTHLKNA